MVRKSVVPALVLSSLISLTRGDAQFISAQWAADEFAVRSSRYNRNFQDPGSPCHPSPCGEFTECVANNNGNPICSCVPGYIPKGSPVDGCLPPQQFPSSPVILHNRLGGGPGHLSVGPPRSSDPCSPSPCGPGTTCTVNRDGNPECRCVPGFTPNPDTITGCKPECNIDPDCRMGMVCRAHRCAAKPDPCQPNPCGPGARCNVNNAGNAICTCEPGLIPKPDTITGCGPECVRDPDCQQGYICQSQRCVVKPDPCDPNPCGPGAECSVTRTGNAICRCQPGLIPNPDTISGCKPECVIDPDCQRGFVCQNQKCIEKPDPCVPSPCGPGADCSVTRTGNAICRCQPGLIPNPDTISGCKPECVVDPDCQRGFVCQTQRCVEKPDPCDPSPCGPGAVCTVNIAGNPICRCEPGLIPKPDTITGCGPECTRDPECQQGYVCQSQRCVPRPDPCQPSPCGPNTECMENRQGNPVCRCLAGYIPMPDTISGCRRECEVDSDCGPGNVCDQYRCVPRPDPCDPSPCGPNTECNENRQGNPVCTCLPGYQPQPDTITGCSKIEARTPPPDPCFPSPCGPNTNCNVNRLGNPVCQCISGYIPAPDTITGCKEKPDPCNPNPCGPNADCVPTGDTATCRCPAGYKGDPFVSCRKGDCEYDRECPQSLACFNYNCKDPCIGTCGQNTNCEVRNHRPICSCVEGFRGDPLISCDRQIVIGGRQSARTPPERNVIVIGQEYSDRRESEVVESRHVVGSRYSGNSGSGVTSARSSPGSSFTVVGAGFRRRRDLEAFMRLIL